MVHAPFLMERSMEADGGPSGHVLMASCPPASSFDMEGVEHTHDVVHTEHRAWGQLDKAELSVLMELSKQLNLDGEITPVMAWGMVLSHPRFHEIHSADFQKIAEELLRKVRCYG